MEAMEKAIEENREAMESRLSLIKGMIQRLAAAWEKKSPTTNVHTLVRAEEIRALWRMTTIGGEI